MVDPGRNSTRSQLSEELQAYELLRKRDYEKALGIANMVLDRAESNASSMSRWRFNKTVAVAAVVKAYCCLLRRNYVEAFDNACKALYATFDVPARWWGLNEIRAIANAVYAYCQMIGGNYIGVANGNTKNALESANYAIYFLSRVGKPRSAWPLYYELNTIANAVKGFCQIVARKYKGVGRGADTTAFESAGWAISSSANIPDKRNWPLFYEFSALISAIRAYCQMIEGNYTGIWQGPEQTALESASGCISALAHIPGGKEWPLFFEASALANAVGAYCQLIEGKYMSIPNGPSETAYEYACGASGAVGHVTKGTAWPLFYEVNAISNGVKAYCQLDAGKYKGVENGIKMTAFECAGLCIGNLAHVPGRTEWLMFHELNSLATAVKAYCQMLDGKYRGVGKGRDSTAFESALGVTTSLANVRAGTSWPLFHKMNAIANSVMAYCEFLEGRYLIAEGGIESASECANGALASLYSSEGRNDAISYESRAIASAIKGFCQMIEGKYHGVGHGNEMTAFELSNNSISAIARAPQGTSWPFFYEINVIANITRAYCQMVARNYSGVRRGPGQTALEAANSAIACLANIPNKKKWPRFYELTAFASVIRAYCQMMDGNYRGVSGGFDETAFEAANAAVSTLAKVSKDWPFFFEVGAIANVIKGYCQLLEGKYRGVEKGVGETAYENAVGATKALAYVSKGTDWVLFPEVAAIGNAVTAYCQMLEGNYRGVKKGPGQTAFECANSAVGSLSLLGTDWPMFYEINALASVVTAYCQVLEGNYKGVPTGIDETALESAIAVIGSFAHMRAPWQLHAEVNAIANAVIAYCLLLEGKYTGEETKTEKTAYESAGRTIGALANLRDEKTKWPMFYELNAMASTIEAYCQLMEGNYRGVPEGKEATAFEAAGSAVGSLGKCSMGTDWQLFYELNAIVSSIFAYCQLIEGKFKGVKTGRGQTALEAAGSTVGSLAHVRKNWLMFHRVGAVANAVQAYCQALDGKFKGVSNGEGKTAVEYNKSAAYSLNKVFGTGWPFFYPTQTIVEVVKCMYLESIGKGKGLDKVDQNLEQITNENLKAPVEKLLELSGLGKAEADETPITKCIGEKDWYKLAGLMVSSGCNIRETAELVRSIEDDAIEEGQVAKIVETRIERAERGTEKETYNRKDTLQFLLFKVLQEKIEPEGLGQAFQKRKKKEKKQG